MALAIFVFVALPVALFFIPIMLRAAWLPCYAALLSAALLMASGYESRHGDVLGGFADALSGLYWAWLIAATIAGILLSSAIPSERSAASALS